MKWGLMDDAGKNIDKQVEDVSIFNKCFFFQCDTYVKRIFPLRIMFVLFDLIKKAYVLTFNNIVNMNL